MKFCKITFSIYFNAGGNITSIVNTSFNIDNVQFNEDINVWRIDEDTHCFKHIFVKLFEIILLIHNIRKQKFIFGVSVLKIREQCMSVLIIKYFSPVMKWKSSWIKQLNELYIIHYIPRFVTCYIQEVDYFIQFKSIFLVA